MSPFTSLSCFHLFSFLFLKKKSQKKSISRLTPSSVGLVVPRARLSWTAAGRRAVARILPCSRAAAWHPGWGRDPCCRREPSPPASPPPAPPWRHWERLQTPNTEQGQGRGRQSDLIPLSLLRSTGCQPSGHHSAGSGKTNPGERESAAPFLFPCHALNISSE